MLVLIGKALLFLLPAWLFLGPGRKGKRVGPPRVNADGKLVFGAGARRTILIGFKGMGVTPGPLGPAGPQVLTTNGGLPDAYATSENMHAAGIDTWAPASGPIDRVWWIAPAVWRAVSLAKGSTAVTDETGRAYAVVSDSALPWERV